MEKKLKLDGKEKRKKAFVMEYFFFGFKNLNKKIEARSKKANKQQQKWERHSLLRVAERGRWTLKAVPGG